MLLIYTILYSTLTNLVADTKLKRSFIYDPFLYFLSFKMSEYNDGSQPQFSGRFKWSSPKFVRLN